MNRILFVVIPVAAACTALGQVPIAPPPASANVVTESSRVSRFVAGPGDRPQGFVLRNGTFVLLPPGLSERLPASVDAGASISVTGNEFNYSGNRTIQAQRISIGGVAYQDAGPAADGQPVPPPPSGRRRLAVPPAPPLLSGGPASAPGVPPGPPCGAPPAPVASQPPIAPPAPPPAPDARPAEPPPAPQAR